MSDASRQERAFLRYLYQDDPDTLATETAALQRQMDADFWSEWWCTSNNAKCSRLIAMEAKRHCRADPRLSLQEHAEGLGGLLYATERAVDDDDEYERLLAKIPHIDDYQETWSVTVDRLHKEFPELSFAAGRSDAIQEFLSPARQGEVPFPGGPPLAANGANALTALIEYKQQVTQEPRRVPRDGPEGNDASVKDEERREANNLWLSWLAYTKVLNEKYPRVLDEALTDVGVLASRGTDKDQDGRPVLVRIRDLNRRVKKPVISLMEDPTVRECETIEDAMFQVLHWHDYLVESGRLAKLPPLPKAPTKEQARHDLALAVDGYAAKIAKHIDRALGKEKGHDGNRHAPHVWSYPGETPRIELPQHSALPFVRGKAAYEAWRQCGLLDPIQYIVSAESVLGLGSNFGQHVPEQLIALLGQGMAYMSKGMAWQISTATFAFQALHPAEFEADITDLENWLAKKRYTIEISAAEREKRAETGAWVHRQPLQVPYFIARGNSLEECTLRLRRTQPGLPFDWAQLGLGTRLVRADGETLFLGV